MGATARSVRAAGWRGEGATDMSEAKITLAKVFILFMLFSCIGWCYEIINDLIVQGGFHPRATFAGPWCPIYGIGGLLIVFCFKPVAERLAGRWPKVVEVLVVAVGIFLLVSLVELVASYACEALLGFMPWDYSTSWGNFQGRVAPEFTMRFVIGGLVFLYFLEPWIARWCDAWPHAAVLIACVLAALFALDAILELAGVWQGIIPRGEVYVQ